MGLLVPMAWCDVQLLLQLSLLLEQGWIRTLCTQLRWGCEGSSWVALAAQGAAAHL